MEETQKSAASIPMRLQACGVALFVLLTYAVNYYLHGNTDFRQSLAVGGSQVALFYAYCYLIRLSFQPGNRRYIAICILVLTLVVPLAVPLLVFGVYPLLGVSLQPAGAVTDWREFFAKTLIALKTVWIAAWLYYVFYRKEITQLRVNSLEREKSLRDKERAELKSELLLHASQSHYAKHVLANLVAHAVSKGDRYTAEQVAHIGKTFDYVAEAAQQDMPIVSIHRALAYFRQVADAIRLRRDEGEGTVIIEMQGDPTMQLIGPLTLTTLLENSDTHGWVDVAHPIRASFVFSRGRLEFRCTNAKRTKRSTRSTSGQGLSFVHQELTMLARHQVSLDIYEDEATYTVCLTIIYQ